MTPERPEREAAAAWRSRAFGVDLELCFPMPALIAAPTPSGAPDCHLELALDEQIDERRGGQVRDP
jgi:hypothetical protein